MGTRIGPSPLMLYLVALILRNPDRSRIPLSLLLPLSAPDGGHGKRPTRGRFPKDRKGKCSPGQINRRGKRGK